MRKPTHITEHPNGGHVHWFALANGLFVSVLTDGYLGDEVDTGYELHERTEDGSVVQFTEQRADNWSGINTIIDQIETRS